MADKDIYIGESAVGVGHPAYIIAEVGQAHDGSLGMAHAFIEAVATTGASAIKFQTHFADAESSKYDKFRVNVFPQDKTRHDYWKRMEFTEQQWAGIATHCDEVGLDFLSSPFSLKAIDVLERIGVKAWKIASGEVNNTPALGKMVLTRKPILLSSGMSTWQDLDQTVDFLHRNDASWALFQCTTAYPCPPEKIGLNIMQEMRVRYDVPTGLSDHSGSIFPSIAAVALGGNLIECHITMSRHAFGPDVSASLEISEFSEMVAGIKIVETIRDVPVDKDNIAAEVANLKKLFGKGLYAARDIKVGEMITAEDIALKKPALDLGPESFDLIVGKIALCDYKDGDAFLKDQFGG